MSLVNSTQFTRSSRPARTTSIPSEAYVLSLASLPSHYAAASSAPQNTIYLYDKANLRPTSHFVGHQRAITGMRTVTSVAGSSRESLVSCSIDALVKVWDERTGTAGLQMHALAAGKSRALLSCDVSVDGLTVAAGTAFQGEDACILYWDPRNPAAPIRVHSSTHSEDITAVHFLKTSNAAAQRDTLLSASSDGLVSTSNAKEADEDEAGLHVGNWGCSIAQVGWVSDGSDIAGVWASSDMETFSVWSTELDRALDVDIRQPSIHRQDLAWVTDYLIGCHNNVYTFPEHDNDLTLFAGSNEGDIAMISRSQLTDLSAPWTLHRLWTSAHVGVVRSVLWDEHNNIILTGGEDSKLNAWSCPSMFTQSEGSGPKRENDSDDMDVDGVLASPSHKRLRS